jgi:3'-phosphoadenosine 5'-phosphosulfate sulfotransferase (PAPS reductase)/FAD synthetase
MAMQIDLFELREEAIGAAVESGELPRIRELIARGAHFYCGHSGGKDSQAMYIYLRELVPADQLHVIHADLGDVEWTGVKDHIRANIDGRELLIAQAVHNDGSRKDLFSAIRARRVFLDTPSAKHPDARRDTPAFPSGSARFCTSDLKTGPIWTVIRRAGHRLVVNCCGIRAGESPARKEKLRTKGALRINATNTNGARDAFDWWPLAHWNCRTDQGFRPSMKDDIFDTIRDAGQQPHPQYAAGNERLSCVFCIFGSPNDLRNGAAQRPELAARYAQLERDVRGTMFHTESLADRLS